MAHGGGCGGTEGSLSELRASWNPLGGAVQCLLLASSQPTYHIACPVDEHCVLSALCADRGIAALDAALVFAEHAGPINQLAGLPTARVRFAGCALEGSSIAVKAVVGALRRGRSTAQKGGGRHCELTAVRRGLDGKSPLRMGRAHQLAGAGTSIQAPVGPAL